MNLMHGDCLELLPTLPTDSVDLICCDLPYGTTKGRWDTPLPLETLWGEYDRVLKPNGATLLFAQVPFSIELGASNLKNLRYEIVWHKTNPTGHLNAKRMPMKAHENILVFYRKLPTYNPQKTQGHERKTSRGAGASTLYGEQRMESRNYNSTERYPTSVQVFPSDKQKLNLHPTQKPEALLEWLIKTYSSEGDTVLDNCMGSGTTGVACARTGRHFVGMELEPEYFRVATRRLKEYTSE